MKKPKRAEWGFTLIEILIVMLIISIVSAAAILTISRNQTAHFQNLAAQITNMLKLSEEQALLQSSVLGLGFAPHSFQFYQFKDKKSAHENPWQAVNDKLLGLHQIPDDIQIQVKVRNHAVPLIDENNTQPQIIISTTGDIIPFTILIGKVGSKPRYQIIGNANGSLESAPIHS